jgi:hypothetical protein
MAFSKRERVASRAGTSVVDDGVGTRIETRFGPQGPLHGGCGHEREPGLLPTGLLERQSSPNPVKLSKTALSTPSSSAVPPGFTAPVFDAAASLPNTPRGVAHEKVRGEVTVRLNSDSERGMRVACSIRSNKLTIFETKDEKAVLARVALGELQVTVWPQSPDMFGLASGCNTVDDIVCCADSEHIRNEWLDVFHRLGIDIATKLGADDEEYDEEQQARSRRAEHCAVPPILCDTADEKGLKRGVAARTSARTPPPRLFASIQRSALNSPSPWTGSLASHICAGQNRGSIECLDVSHRLGIDIDIATKLGADDEEYDEEQQARSRRAEHCAVPPILCDTADEKGLKRGVAARTSARTPPPRLFASIQRSALNSPSPWTRSSQI